MQSCSQVQIFLVYLQQRRILEASWPHMSTQPNNICSHHSLPDQSEGRHATDGRAFATDASTICSSHAKLQQTAVQVFHIPLGILLNQIFTGPKIPSHSKGDKALLAAERQHFACAYLSCHCSLSQWALRFTGFGGRPITPTPIAESDSPVEALKMLRCPSCGAAPCWRKPPLSDSAPPPAAASAPT